MRLGLLFGIAVVFAGCQSYSEDELSKFDEEIQNYIDEENLEMEKLESGLYYSITADTTSGQSIRYTDQVTFYYSGAFLNGEVFQEIPKDAPLTFKVSELIAGWQEGLMQLHGPGTIELIIPPNLGYGSKNTEKIPPNSILFYELTVTDIK